MIGRGFLDPVVEPGQLNLRVVLQQQSTTQDSYGQPLETWAAVATVWASIAVQTSQLVYQTAEFVSKITHRVTMRWTNSLVIQPNMRVVYTEPVTGVVHTYNVEALLNADQRNRILTVLCYELDSQE